MPILIALQSLIFRNLRVLRLFLNSDFAKNLTYMMSFLQLLFASLPWVFQQTLSPAKKLTIILLNNYINTLGLSTARASNFFFNMMAGATSEWTLISYLSRHDRSVLPTWDFQLCSLFVWSDDQTCLIKMAKYWPHSKKLQQKPFPVSNQTDWKSLINNTMSSV